MGKPLMPWQQQVADVALEVDEKGRFAYQLVIVTVPRQSGKTTLFGAVMDHRALIVPNARVWYTQQSGKHAVDWLINEHWPLLGPFVPKVHLRRAAGSEHVKWLPSGGLVRPFPPTPDGLHGKTSDLVVVDEPWALDLGRGQQLDQAIVPTQATTPNARVWRVIHRRDATSTWWLGSVEGGPAAVTATAGTGSATSSGPALRRSPRPSRTRGRNTIRRSGGRSTPRPCRRRWTCSARTSSPARSGTCGCRRRPG
jgi:hypothetical protein